VGQPHDVTVSIVVTVAAAGGDEAQALQLGHRPEAAELVGDLHGQGLADRDEVEHPSLGTPQVNQSAEQQLTQAVAAGQLALPAPRTVAPVEHSLGMSSMQHLAHVQRSACGDAPHTLDHRGLDRPVERMAHQFGDLRLGERLEIDPVDEALLPQRDDRIRTVLVRPDGDDHPGPGLGGQVQHERRRRLVEQVGIVDSDDDRPGVVEQGGRDLPQHVQPIGRRTGRSRGAPGDERAEWDGGRRSGRPHQDGPPPVGGGARQELGDQPRLPHARETGDDHRPGTVLDGAAQEAQLLVTADKWPGFRRPFDSHPPRCTRPTLPTGIGPSRRSSTDRARRSNHR